MKDLSAEEITSIAEDYLGGEGRLEEAFIEKFGGEIPEVLNENQHMVVVASEIDDSSARIIGFLSDAYGVGINAVTFNYFRTEDGKEFLARVFLIEPEQAESNVQKAPSRRRAASTLEDLCARADRYGNGEGFRTILKAAERAAEKHPLNLRTTKNSVMVTPRANRTRTLFTFWPRYGTRDQLTIAVPFENWPEYFDVEEETVASILGPDNFRIGITYQDVEEFSANVDRLFEKIEQKTG